MSDYLSRAAERAGGIGSGVRPTLPSLFDSDKGPADSVMPTLKSPEAQQHLKEGPGNAEETTIHVSGVQERVASILALAPETPAAKQTEKREPMVQQKFDDVVPSKVRGRSTELETSSEKPSFPERSHVRPSLVQLDPVAEPSSLSHAGVEPSVELPSKTVRNNPPSAARRRAAGLRPTQTRNQIRFADRESPSDRTIHVTIGRLEVRAVQSASPPAKPAPPKPRISLDEYLRSRNGGDR